MHLTSHYPDSNGKVRIRWKLASESVQSEGRKDRKSEGERSAASAPPGRFSIPVESHYGRPPDISAHPKQMMPTLPTK